MIKDNTIGFATLLKNVSGNGLTAFNYPINDDSGSLRIETAGFKNYVQPVFSIVSHFGEEHSFDEARVILVSAVGATGKTTLAKELSYQLHCPIVDLGCSEVMAGNSLTGILFKKLAFNDSYAFVNDLRSGNTAMIIDGLDEGFQRTKTQGYYDFLDDVITLSSTQGRSFILLGRTNAIGLAALHFESKGIPTITYQIEPFTIKQAEEFIDNNLKNEKGVDIFSKPYQELRNYIIESIGGFFKDRQDVKKSQYERFIGYAPVLLSIAEFLRKNKENFQRVLSDFQKDKLRGNTLILSIVEGIMRRDKEMKIQPQLIEEKLHGRSLTFQCMAREKAYSFDEQCARVLYRCLDRPYTLPVTGDERFDFEYSQGIERWIDEHPFLAEKKITNTVFEGYILARLISNPLYRNVVDEYIQRQTGMSYMFFSIYQEMYKDNEFLDLSIVSYLYTSLKALDNKKKYYRLNFTYDEEDAEDLAGATRNCYLEFEGSEDSDLPNYQFKVSINSKSRLQLHNFIGDVYIDVPINVEISSPHIVLSAPGYINCKNVEILTDEVVLTCKTQGDLFTIEANTVDLVVDKTYPNVISEGESKKYFTIVCDNVLPHPLNEFQSSMTQKCFRLNSIQKEYYKKMRRTLIMFRSHSKGEFAKIQSKINNRIASKTDGRIVVNALLEKGIIYPRERFYVIDKDKMNEHLGLKFDGIRACVINEKVIEFIQGMK